MSKLGKEGYKWHFGICLSDKKTKKMNSGCLLQISKEKNVKSIKKMQ